MPALSLLLIPVALAIPYVHISALHKVQPPPPPPPPPPPAWVWPLQGTITQDYGCTYVWSEQYDAGCYSRHFHNGIDIATGGNDVIVAAHAGQVTDNFGGLCADWYGFGNCILETDTDGTQTLYGHLAEFLVPSGTSVSAGQPIGIEGSTGNSTGDHLHFSVLVNGSSIDPHSVLP